MSNQFINPAGIATPNGYTHVVTTDARKLVFISGQIGVDANGEMKGGLAAQTTQVFENLRIALAAAGATFEHVVKITVYIVNYTPAARQTLVETRNRYFHPQHPPASTLVGVSALAFPGLLIEIEAIVAME
ncbi:RidA family protein [Anaerolineae bacterium CFX7]|nr:RidA family protein [Anaerolineae bacterium CFX7]